MKQRHTRERCLWDCVVLGLAAAAPVMASPGVGGPHPAPWVWPLTLFGACFLLGIVAVLAGVGGGVLFVPIVSGLFPFHLDFVRGTGLLIALAGALAASPRLLTQNLASLRLALPSALVASIFTVVGARLGLALPTAVCQTLMGAVILLVALLFHFSRGSELPSADKADPLSRILGIHGAYREPSDGKIVTWHVRRTPLGILLFALIGLMGGMFGLGAGWANVPVFNLLMGVPLKVAVATSTMVLTSTAPAIWIYLNNGAVLAPIAVPSVLGMMLGASIGVRLLAKARPAHVRHMVIAMLVVAGVRSLLKGLGIWG